MRCGNCGQALAQGARFCSSCGAAVPAADESSTTAPSGGGERRQLAVLFADLVDSTPLSQKLDAEEFADLVLEYQAAGAAAIAALGGTVGNYLGDGMLAWFGWPVAHEDDAARAVQAALDILACIEELNAGTATALGVQVAARVGVHVGPVVVGDLTGGVRPDTPAFGETLNVAARLESSAAPGTVVISEPVRRLLGRRFSTRDLGAVELKGVGRPLQVHAVDGAEAGGIAARTHANVPLVGREAELEALVDAWTAARDGTGHAAVITGEPGVGKSRLIAAVEGRLAGQPHRRVELHCTPLGEHTAFGPVVGAVRRTFGISPADPPAKQRRRLARGAQELMVEPGILTVFEALLGISAVGDEPFAPGAEVQRHQLIEGILGWLLGMTQRRAVVLTVEDAHWCDPSTLELLSLLHDRSANSRLLLVFTRRPEGDVELAGDRVARIALEPLDARHARTLAHELAAELGLDPGTAERAAERADGVPLFVEELIRSVADGDEDLSDVPVSLQASLTSRIDRLGAAKDVAQLGAVLGRTFSADLLAAVAPQQERELHEALDRLAASGLLDTRTTFDGEVHEFRHALIRDAAYEMILRRRRRELHRRVADVLEERFPERAEAEPQLVAHHFAEDSEPLRAAQYFDRAGRSAARSGALAEAAGHYARGLELLEGLAESPERAEVEQSLLIMNGNALMGLVGNGAEVTGTNWRRAVAVAEARGDHEELTSALNGLAVYHLDQGEFDVTIELAQRILEIGERSGSRVARLRGHGSIGMARFMRGEGAAGLEHLQASIEAYRPGDFQLVTYGLGHDQGVAALGFLAWTSCWLGRPDTALVHARASMELAEETGSFLSIAMARHCGAVVHDLRDEPELALASASANVEFSREMRFPLWEGLGLLVGGTQRAKLGDPEGVEDVNRGIGLLANIASRVGLSTALSWLADAHRASGNLETALGTLDGALAMEPPFRQGFYDARLLCSKAEVMLAQEPDANREAAERALREALAVAEAQDAVAFGARAATTLAGLLAQAGRPDDAHAVLSPWVDRLVEGDDVPFVRAARAQLDVLIPAPREELL